jgi:hypothetical protein
MYKVGIFSLGRSPISFAVYDTGVRLVLVDIVMRLGGHGLRRVMYNCESLGCVRGAIWRDWRQRDAIRRFLIVILYEGRC